MSTPLFCRYSSFLLVALFSICLINYPATIYSQPAPEQGNELDEAKKEELRVQFANAPAFFIENQGQTAEEVKYYFKGKDTVYFTDEGVVFRKTVKSRESGVESRGVKFNAPTDAQPATFKSLAYKLDFVGAKPTAPEARNKQKGKVSYLKGNDRSKWHTDIPTYQEIVYPELYPPRHSERSEESLSSSGIDLIYKGVHGGMKYEFIVQPGADPDVIKLAYTGIEGLSIDDTGNLIIHTGLGDVRDTKPYCYQEIDGVEVEVKCNFKIHPLSLRGSETTEAISNPHFEYGFELAPYNTNYPLIIDPGLEYSTFLGGSGDDLGIAIAVDGSGYAYVTGHTPDDITDFPFTLGAYRTTHNDDDGDVDAFVTKLNTTGTALEYSTFLGGSDNDGGFGIAVDGSGYAYVTGITYSTDFPTFPDPGAYDGVYNDDGDAFVTKLNTTGTDLEYSTFLGGSDNDVGLGIAVDGSGYAYVTGDTDDGITDFPTTGGAYTMIHNDDGDGGSDVFVTKLNTTGTGLEYSTFLGGSSSDIGNAIAVDGSGYAYVTGSTNSDDFPPTVDAYNENRTGSSDVFVTKLNTTGTGLDYSTFIGGNGNDVGNGIALDGSGNVYVTGETRDNTIDFPTTTDAYEGTHNDDGNNGTDVFVFKLDPTNQGAGIGLLYSTFLGGNGGDLGSGIAVDSGNVYVTGFTISTDFPTTPGAYDEDFNGLADVFVSKLDPTNQGAGIGLLYSTFLGGGGWDWGHGIAVDGFGKVYVTGFAADDTPDFPTTPGAFDTSNSGGSDPFYSDVFVAKLDPSCTENDTGQLDVQGVSGGSGDTINVAVRIQNAPNLVKLFGFDLVYDTSLLTFTGNATRGGLTTDFDTLIVYEASFGTVSVVGFEDGSDTIAGSASGDVVLLEFTMQPCTIGDRLAIAFLTNLMYDISGWTSSRGCLLCTVPATTTTTTTTTSTTTSTTTTTICDVSTYYRDADGDGFGDKKNESMLGNCPPPIGYVRNKTDCDDTDPDIHPGAVELCNGVDDDCNGKVDEGYKSLRRIKRSPRKIFIDVAAGGTRCKEFYVKRKGEGDYSPISWEIVKSGCSWLTLTPLNGAIGLGLKKSTVEACVDATGLVAGRYKCVLTITDTAHPCPNSRKAQKTMKVIVRVR
jgi:hypothetical protein